MTAVIHYQTSDFIVFQGQDGTWGYYHKELDTPDRPANDGLLTREQAERGAALLAYRLQEDKVIEDIVRERLEVLINTLADERVKETGLDRQEVLSYIQEGLWAAIWEHQQD
jgi:uncharacterized protein (UPF0128 family)